MTIIQIPATPRIYGSFKFLPISWSDGFKEYLDNSIDSLATICQFYTPQGLDEDNNKIRSGYFNLVEILDNGSGMNQDTLKRAWAYGSEVSYTSTSHGKFGMGLTASSVKLANHVKIITKSEDNGFYTLEWDIDYVESYGWGVELRKSTNDEIIYFVKRQKSIDKNIDITNITGTLIILKKLTFDLRGSITRDKPVDGLRIETLRDYIQKELGVSHYGNIKGETWPMFDGDIVQSLHKCKILFNKTVIKPIDPIYDLYDSNLSVLDYDSSTDGGLKHSPNLRLRCFLIKPMNEHDRRNLNIYHKDSGTYFCRQGRYITRPKNDQRIIGYNWFPYDTFVRSVISWDKLGDGDISLNFIKNMLDLSGAQKKEIEEKMHPTRIKSRTQHFKYKKTNSTTDKHKKDRKIEDQKIIDFLNNGTQDGSIPALKRIAEIRKRREEAQKKRERKEKRTTKNTRQPKKYRKVIPNIIFEYENWGENDLIFRSFLDGGTYKIIINEDTRFYQTMFKDGDLVNNDAFKTLMYGLACAKDKAAEENINRYEIVSEYLEMVSTTINRVLREMERTYKIADRYEDDGDYYLEELPEELAELVESDEIIVNT